MSHAKTCHAAFLAFLTVCCGHSQGFAQAPADPVPAPVAEGEALIGGERSFTDRLTISGSVDYTNKYYFRGIIQEDRGFIIQPGLELGFDLYEKEGYSVSLFAGVWNSFHDRKTGASDPDETIAQWYEFDFYAGLSLTFGRVAADVAYTLYESPNGAFRHVDELSLTLSLDDSGWLGDFTIAPYATLAWEIGGGQADGGESRGVFLALGIEPGYTFESTAIGDLTLSMPIESGFSLSNYYEDENGDDEGFGYFTVGLTASIGLPAPDGFGAWSLSVGVDHLLLGSHTKAMNNGDSSEWIFRAGISFEF